MTDQPAVQALFERTVVAAIRFCGQSVYMFRFLLSPPSSLQKEIADGDTRLPPPLSFLTVGVFVAGMVHRLAYAMDPGESYTAEVFSAEFHESYRQISLWEVSLRTFPGVVLVVLIGVVLAKLAKSSLRFDRNPIVATACYCTGLHALAVGIVRFTIMWVNAFHSSEFAAAIAYRTEQRLITCAVALTGLYGILALAMSLRMSAQRKWMRPFWVHFPAGVSAMIFLLSVTYLTVEVSFETSSAETQQGARWQRYYREGFRVSLIDSQTVPNANNQFSQLQATLALTNLSDEKILVPRHRELVTRDDNQPLRVVTNSIDQSEDKALIIEPNQTRVLQMDIDMTPVCMKLVSGEISQTVVFPFHKASDGYSFTKRQHILSLPLPAHPIVGRGVGLPPGTEIGRAPADGFRSLLSR